MIPDCVTDRMGFEKKHLWTVEIVAAAVKGKQCLCVFSCSFFHLDSLELKSRICKIIVS